MDVPLHTTASLLSFYPKTFRAEIHQKNSFEDKNSEKQPK